MQIHTMFGFFSAESAATKVMKLTIKARADLRMYIIIVPYWRLAPEGQSDCYVFLEDGRDASMKRPVRIWLAIINLYRGLTDASSKRPYHLLIILSVISAAFC